MSEKEFNNREEKRRMALRKLSEDFRIEKSDFDGLDTVLQAKLYHRILNSQEKIKEMIKRVGDIK